MRGFDQYLAPFATIQWKKQRWIITTLSHFITDYCHLTTHLYHTIVLSIYCHHLPPSEESPVEGSLYHHRAWWIIQLIYYIIYDVPLKFRVYLGCKPRFNFHDILGLQVAYQPCRPTNFLWDLPGKGYLPWRKPNRRPPSGNRKCARSSRSGGCAKVFMSLILFNWFPCLFSSTDEKRYCLHNMCWWLKSGSWERVHFGILPMFHGACHLATHAHTHTHNVFDDFLVHRFGRFKTSTWPADPARKKKEHDEMVSKFCVDSHF